MDLPRSMPEPLTGVFEARRLRVLLDRPNPTLSRRELLAMHAAPVLTSRVLTPQAVTTPRVLLVEADPAVAAALQRGLRRAGWTVLWAADAGAALRLKPAYAPDAVLLSLDLPDMDGSVLLARLARDGDCAIVALSGRGEAVRAAMLGRGAHDYLAKPMAMRDILVRLQAAVWRWALVVLAGKAAGILCPA